MGSNFFGAFAGAAFGVVVMLAIWTAVVDDTVDDDYVCVCQPGSGGDPAQATAYDVGTGQPVEKTCPHPRNRNNDFNCNAAR
ncbi:MAG: hypothetical protein KDI82_01015 [Gammaproteobacteria bacterium]|nr:hypothetical protein [Gammaproteobacteria bacterium]